jgi:hypothetical protein
MENLKPWKPGQSGNPGGRPRRNAITGALSEQLASHTNGGSETVADAIAAALIKGALRGDVRAIREIADRTEGRPRQQFNIEASATFSDTSPKYDFSRFSDEQLCRLAELLELAKSGTQPEIETNQSASEM